MEDTVSMDANRNTEFCRLTFRASWKMGTPGWKRQESAAAGQERVKKGAGGGAAAGTSPKRRTVVVLSHTSRFHQKIRASVPLAAVTPTQKDGGHDVQASGYKSSEVPGLTVSVVLGVKLLTAAFVVAEQSHGCPCPLGWTLQKVLRIPTPAQTPPFSLVWPWLNERLKIAASPYVPVPSPTPPPTVVTAVRTYQKEGEWTLWDRPADNPWTSVPFSSHDIPVMNTGGFKDRKQLETTLVHGHLLLDS